MVFNQESDNREDTLQGSADEREGKFTPLTLSTSQSPPPDGGFAAWCVVVGAWCTSFCSFGWLNSELEPWRLILPCIRLADFCHRYWHIPGLLREGTPQGILFKHSRVDPVSSGLLHVSCGELPVWPSWTVLTSSQGPVVGHVYDRHGPRVLIIVGAFMHVFGLMMASISKEYYQLLLSQGVCSAIGAAAIFQPGEWLSSSPILV